MNQEPEQPTVAIESEEPGNIVEPLTDDMVKATKLTSLEGINCSPNPKEYTKADKEPIPDTPEFVAPIKAQLNSSDIEAVPAPVPETTDTETAGKPDSKVVAQVNARRSICSRLRPTSYWSVAAMTGSVVLATIGIYGFSRRFIR